MFVDNAITEVLKGGDITNLPLSVPETIITYLKDVNPDDEHMSYYLADDVMIKAAHILGFCSLKNNYTPGDFFEDDAIIALKEEGMTIDGKAVIERFILNGILLRHSPGGINVLRFIIDPVSEYFAAIYWVNKLKADKKAWNAFFRELQKNKGFYKTSRGFLIALEDCIKTYKNVFKIPDVGDFFVVLNE